MRLPHHSLFAAIGLALAGGMFPAVASTSAVVSAPSGVSLRYVEEAELSSVLQAALRDPSVYLALPDEPGSDGSIAWAPASIFALDDERAQVDRAFASGRAVLVTGGDTADDASSERIAHIFGYASSAAVALYSRDPDGRLRVESIETTATAIAAPDTFGGSRTGRREIATFASTDGGAPQVSGPYIAVTESMRGAGGAKVIMDITVARDTAGGRDHKVVMVRTNRTLVPFTTGFHSWGTGKQRRTGWVVPLSYESQTALTVPRSALEHASSPLTLAEQFPETTGFTAHKFSDKRTTSTTFGVGANAEIMAGLGKDGPSTSKKLGASVSFSKTTTHENVVEFSLDDYTIETGEYDRSSDTHLRRVASWRYPVAAPISAGNAYWGKDPESRITPSMKRASVSTLAVWRVDAGVEEPVSIEAKGEVTNFFAGGLAAWGAIADSETAEGFLQQPRIRARVDLGSPLLTFSPTVLIQSAAGSGDCLAAWFGTQTHSLPMLRPCDTPADRKVQWTLDEQGRYRNRATGSCLAFVPGTGGIGMEPCALASHMRWAWRADRLHSLFDGGSGGVRLHLKEGELHGAVDLDVFSKSVPANPFNPLLPPWSGYPDFGPSAGSFVPNLGGASQQLSKDALTLKVPVAEERWNLIPVTGTLLLGR